METDYEPIIGAVDRTLSDELRDEWDALAERVGTVFSSRRSYALNAPRPAGSELVFVHVRRGTRLVALAPMFVTRLGPLKVAKILGAGQGVPTELLSEDDASSRVLWDAVDRCGLIFYADSMIGDRNAVEALGAHQRWRSESIVRERVPVIDVPEGSTARDVRGHSSLKRLGKYRRQAERAGSPLTMETIRDAKHFERRWADISRLAAASTLHSDRTDYLAEESPADPSASAKDFLAREAAAGRLTLSGVSVEGRWRAHQICVRTGARLEAWLTHYDPEVAKYQPGHQMMEWFVQSHDELDVTVLDLGVGVNDIKKSWSTSGYDVLAVVGVPTRMVGSRILVGLVRRWELSPGFAHARRVGYAALSRLRPSTH
ncbi:GNAT family N-acetyltransferase [Rhodococcus sp. IEGM 1343]|uniref:GNAT family N-acetyltransferase n=1 Tax=Rhodococcus sp. IEGM 1343 TaxID=3082224 RepID=UPI0029547372|nr:GNAT family N-acetyltransferase [Rhodococcus sp. IEGM 1343]MDV8056357.1 GNAT family N-acetyltransferase [Rhodococcus sp. IEGM 1343]